MTKITLDQSFVGQLAACKDLTVLCDPQGNVLGTFEPMRFYEEGEIPEFDEAELDRREKRRSGIPSDVALQILKSMQ